MLVVDEVAQQLIRKVKAAIVTDTGGVDDKSFNQSAWEGLKLGVKLTNLKKILATITSNLVQSLTLQQTCLQAQSQGYNLIFGVGFALHDAAADAAKEHEDVNYVIIDDVIKDQRTLKAFWFADNEGAYLAGIAAAMQSKQIKLVSSVVKHQTQLHVLKLVSQLVLSQ